MTIKNIIIPIAYMAIISTIFGMGWWFFMYRNYPVNKVAPFSLLVPVFGVMASIIFMDEILTMPIIIGAVISFIGTCMIVLYPSSHV